MLCGSDFCYGAAVGEVCCCAQGMTLICMARPVSDLVRIETQSDWGYSLGVGEWKGATGHIAGKDVDPLTPWKAEA